MKKSILTFAAVLTVTGSIASAKFADHTIKAFPSVSDHHKIALTIDDGPTPEVTDAMLDVLKQNGVKATFFMLGQNIQRYPEIVERVVAEGHLIGNHTWDHKWLLEKNKEGKWDCRADENFAYNEIRPTHDILKKFVPPTQKRMYFRPPGGGWCSRDTKMMNADRELAKYVGPLYWTMGGNVAYEIDGDRSSPLKDAGDEDCWTESHLSIEKCLEGYRNSIKRHNGGVLLNHDVHMESVELLRVLIPELKAQGYRFITLDEVSGFGAAPAKTAAPVSKQRSDQSQQDKKILNGAGLY